MKNQKILLEGGTNEMELLTFLLEGQPFGVNVSKVQSIIEFDPSALSKIPEAPTELLGMLLYRDKTIPLIDLSAALDRNAKPNEEKSIVIVTEFSNLISAFKVDEVKRIYRTSWNDFVPVSPFLSGSHSTSIVGSINLDNEEVLVVDIEHIISLFIPGLAFEKVSQETLEKADKLGRQNFRIFFAEDSGTIRNNVIKILHKSGYTTVNAFENGKLLYEALSTITSQDASKNMRDGSFPRAIISDIEMPQLDGLSLCKRVREELNLKQIPIIMFSSLINEQMIMKCKSVGASGFVSKPEVNKLIAMLDEICQSRGDQV
jgi:two-component system chemotaxis response regulator CheV